MDLPPPSFISRMPSSLFVPLVVLSDVFGLIAIVLVGVWVGHFSLGGFKWNLYGKLDLHPFIMTLGMILIFGGSTLCYRILGRLGVPRKAIKFVHGTMMAIVIGCTIFALYLVINAAGRNFKSMHAVMGLITTSLFVLQFVFAVSIFAMPCAPQWLRECYMKVHAFFGLVTLISATATCLAGIQLGQIVIQSTNTKIALAAGAFIAAFTATIAYILTNENYRVNKADSINRRSHLENGVPSQD